MPTTASLVEAAMDILLECYQEELNLYMAVRDLTVRQSRMLRQGADLMRVMRILDEKEDLLGIVGRMESEMRGAKAFVLSQPPEDNPRRQRLVSLLDRLTETIEDIRSMERENIRLLEAAPR